VRQAVPPRKAKKKNLGGKSCATMDVSRGRRPADVAGEKTKPIMPGDFIDVQGRERQGDAVKNWFKKTRGKEGRVMR